MPLESILTETKPNRFINDLVDYIVDPNIGGVTPLDLETAPPLIKGIIFLRAFYLSIATAGIWQWFEESYDDYPNLEKFMDEIGATKAADYIRAGKAAFPKGRVLKDSDTRYDFTDEHDRDFRQIDRNFEGAAEESILKLREYILTHRKTLETQARAFWEIRKSNKPKWQKKIAKYR